jgi:hypothetical protein
MMRELEIPRRDRLTLSTEADLVSDPPAKLANLELGNERTTYQMMFAEDSIPSEPMWPEDEGSIDASEFDPFAFTLPGVSVTQKLRYLLSKGIIQPGPNTWRPPNDNTKLITLKCLYAAMVGFDKDRLSLLYSSGALGNTFDELWLTKAQEVLSAPSVRDRCCGHVFEKGETYYRCKYVKFHPFLM